MRKKKKIKPNSVYNINFCDYITYDYNYQRNCFENGCNHEGICRCGTIENFCIESVDNVYSIANAIADEFGKKKDEIFIYCIDRLLISHKIYDADCFESDISRGYYGEELNSVRIDFSLAKALDSEINQLLGSSEKERILFVLEKEYGFVLDSIKNCGFELIKVKQAELQVPNIDYSRKITKKDFSIYDNYPGPIGVFRKENGSLLLVDGYHRYLANKDKRKVPIIAAF